MSRGIKLVVLTARFSNLSNTEISTRSVVFDDLDANAIDGRAQTRLDDDQAVELAAAYENGATIKQLAQRYRINRTTVMRHLDTAGVETRYRAASLNKSKNRQAIMLYEGGSSIANIAAKLGSTQHVVGRELRRAGVKIRSRGFQPRS